MSSKFFMTLSRRILLISFVLLAAISSFGYFFWVRPTVNKRTAVPVKATSNRESKSREVLSRLRLKAASAKDFVRTHGFSQTRCFLVDMRLPSGMKRFFVYNFRKDTVELSGLVTHGSGSETDSTDLLFSNRPNSYCTSLGRYKIGKPYQGAFGLAYKLYGLDETNDKAFDRAVVLHGHSCVPDAEVYPGTICLSLGCPTVSPAFLTHLQDYLDNSAAPVLLWIYY